MPSRGQIYHVEDQFTLERMKIAIEDFVSNRMAACVCLDLAKTVWSPLGLPELLCVRLCKIWYQWDAVLSTHSSDENLMLPRPIICAIPSMMGKDKQRRLLTEGRCKGIVPPRTNIAATSLGCCAIPR